MENKLNEIKSELDKATYVLQGNEVLEEVFETQLIDKQFGAHGLVYTYRIAIKSKKGLITKKNDQKRRTYTQRNVGNRE